MNSIRRAITVQRYRLLPKLSPVYHQHASFSTTRKPSTQTLKVSKSRAPDVTPPSKSLKGAVTWPKPSEIPWQAKVVNSVNLIGRVKIPVQFEASPDGKNWAGTIISQDDGSESSTSPTSFWIPVIFEGDLAHIAMCHLKEKDYVHVAGHLSVDVPPFKLSEVQANVQVMANSINFVQKSQSKKVFTPDELHTGPTNISLKDPDSMYMQQDTLSKKSTMDNDYKSSPICNSKETRHLRSDHKVDKQGSHGSWRDLLTNSKQWIDNREKKSKGLVKPNYPDFKHTDTGVGLWLNKAPVEVLQGLSQLEFFSQPNKSKKGAEFWKHLIENPNRWWDNRLEKKNAKGPDFKNKDSGEALWLTDAPSWVLSSLPPVTAKTDYVNTKKKWASN